MGFIAQADGLNDFQLNDLKNCKHFYAIITVLPVTNFI